MPTYFYTAMNAENIRVTGKITVPNVENLKKVLIEKRQKLVSIYESPIKSVWQWSTVSDRNILLFTRYFASLIKAGISAFKSINILYKQEKNLRLKETLGVISHDVENGSALYEAFSRFPGMFDKVYIGLLRTGEESGRLYELLEKCSDLIETRIVVKRKIIAIVSYPAIILLLILILVFVIFMQIVPKFQTLYGQMGLTLDALPLITKVVIGVADFIRTYFFYELGFIVLFAGVFFQIYSTKAGKLRIDRLFVKIPIIKDIIIKYYIARFSRNLSILFESGFSIIIAFERSDEIVTNLAVKENLIRVKKNIERGNTVSEAFASVTMIPEISREMISIGEQTANFDKMLINIAEFYEKDLDYVTETFMNWIEPTIIIVLGFFVGTILLSIYLPVFSLASNMKMNI
ncbi:MAG: type II secretion system F family protein [Candidatus Muirbacterium halophilum]|nr:type II secretion system F family protein [Candidatus Muirbacterium halophilum]MCK9475732.1 type II secretion system F family protein [Candidatus Muirbacterium halophilum]